MLKKQDPFARTDASIIDESPRSVLSGLAADELETGDAAAAAETLANSLGAERRQVEARGLTPMLCAELPRTTEADADDLLNRQGWLYELKLDGVRIVADKRHAEVALWSRRGPAVTQNYPEIARAVRALPGERLVLDGEIVAFDAAGRPSFARLARRIHARASDVWQVARETPVTYVVFDLLALGDLDLRLLALRHRKELLARVVRGRGFLRCLDHFENAGRPLFDFCRREQLEGLVAKRGDSVYRPGPKRTGDWVKLKCHRDAEFVVIGLTRGEGSRLELGALDVASYRGKELVVRGKVGSGLDQTSIATLLEKTNGHTRPTCAASGKLEPAPNGRTFVEPLTVVSVRFGGWTEEGRLRFPVFQGIRDDIEPQACTSLPPSELLDIPIAEVEPEPTQLLAKDPRVSNGRNDKTKIADERERRVTITHPRKVYWPKAGITKGQLVEYYEQIAGVMLPYLKDRPVIFSALPRRHRGQAFLPMERAERIPSWVATLELPAENGQGRARHGFLINDVGTLKYVVNLGCIPIHILASRTPALDACDFITLDLDVDASTLLEAIVIARSLREIIEASGLSVFPKTSGQSGLHLLVPLGPGVPYAAARLLVELLGRLATHLHPSTATMERRRENRGYRVYVNTGQTGPSRAIVAPYSVRAVPHATISTPLAWDEVTPALAVGRYTLASVPHRLTTRADPMHDMLNVKPDIPRAIVSLESVIQGSLGGSR